MALQRTIEWFLDRCKLVHGSRYAYTKVDYTGCFNKITITCREHGDFLQTPNAHIGKLKQGCRKCSTARQVRRLTRDAAKEFVSKSANKHNYRYSYDKVKYLKSSAEVQIICHVHGAFWQTPNAHLAGRGCRECNLGGFNDRLASHLYLFSCGEYFKIGITNRPVSTRLKDIQLKSKLPFTLVSKWPFATGKAAHIIERKLLKEFSGLYESISEKFNGSTECFVHTNIEDIKDFVDSSIRII